MNIGEVCIPPGSHLMVDLADKLVRVTAIKERLKVIGGSVRCHRFVWERQTAQNIHADGTQVRRRNLVSCKGCPATLCCFVGPWAGTQRQKRVIDFYAGLREVS